MFSLAHAQKHNRHRTESKREEDTERERGKRERGGRHTKKEKGRQKKTDLQADRQSQTCTTIQCTDISLLLFV